jgi:hypothetical protein
MVFDADPPPIKGKGGTMRRFRVSTILAGILLCVVSTASRADLAPYNQDFEGLTNTTDDQPAQVALANDGWKGFVNVFGPNFYYNYGFPAPNGGFGGPAISAVVEGEGGPAQGDQQLVVFSDYNNGNHRDGSNAVIETNVFQEQFIGAADVGKTWRFVFDAKRGNIELASTALAFFKTLNPAAGYALTNFIVVDLTGSTSNWENYTLSIVIDTSLVGQILQFGFLNRASNNEGSGIFYDNIAFGVAPIAVSLDIKPGSCPNPINGVSQGVLPVALLGTADFDVNDVDVSSLRLEGIAPIRSDYEDVAGPFAGQLCGCSTVGPDGYFDLSLKFDTQAISGALGLSPSVDRVVTLTGTLLDGTPIEGQDCVIVIRAGRKPFRAVGRNLAEPILQRPNQRPEVGMLPRSN